MQLNVEIGDKVGGGRMEEGEGICRRRWKGKGWKDGRGKGKI